MNLKKLAALAATFATLLFATPAFAQPTDGLPTPTLRPTKNAAGNYVFYRRVSNWEMMQLLRRKGLFITPGAGESFVSTSREYVDNLGSRHPKDYANLMVIEITPEGFAEIEKMGRRAEGPLLKAIYPKMKVMESGLTNAVHFKAELGVLNLGFRPGSVEVANKYVKSISVDKTARLTYAKEEKSIKESVRRTLAELNEKDKAKPSTGMAALLERRTKEAGSRDKDKSRGR